MNLSRRTIIIGIVAILALVVISITNPLGYNKATTRTVVTTYGGEQFVKFQPGPFWAGFFAKEQVWPNQVGVSYNEEAPDYDLVDNNVEMGVASIQFSDGTQATVQGIAQYILPTNEKEMIEMNNAHVNVEGLVKRRLVPYTKECLGASAQLMTSEMHYSGGKAQMTQDYLNQLQNGSYLLSVKQVNVIDSVDHGQKTMYQVQIQLDKNGQPKRKFSSIAAYGITVGDAQITATDYESKVDSMLAKKIEASTQASVSKQRLMTAQQEAMTAEAQGKKKLVEIEYAQKQDQTKQVVVAQTAVQVAEQNKQEQKVLAEAAELEARKIKTLADANAYDKQRAIQADGALEQKLDAYITVQKSWADAFSKYQGNIVPTYASGGQIGGNGAFNFMEMLGIKAAKDLSLDLKNK